MTDALAACFVVVVVGALLAGLGYSVHLDSVRADQARSECIAKDRMWLASVGSCVGKN